MSEQQALERSVLERKERDELHTIAEALGLKPGTRTKKADLVDTILRAAGVETGDTNGASNGEAPAAEKPKRTRKKAAATDDATGDTTAPVVVEEATSGSEPSADTAEAAPAPASGDVATEVPAEASNGETEKAERPERSEKGERGEKKDKPDGRPERQEQRPRNDRGNQGGGGGNQGGASGGGGAQPGNFQQGEAGRRSRRRRGRDRDRDRDFRVQEQNAEQQYQGDLLPVAGLLDLADQGYGYVRTRGYLPNQDDVYVSLSQARRFALRKGDYVEGAARPPMGNEKYGALLRIDTISGLTPDEAKTRRRFEDLTPLFPDIKLKMESPGKPKSDGLTGRILDLVSPIGKGQRGMIVSPSKAGKTSVIKEVATSIEYNHPEVHLMVVLVDERPEEVTDMRRSVQGEVVSSTFDRPSDEHTIVAELALERAKRLVELGKDVVIILDGITRLARAYNLSAPASGRLTSGGIDQAAIYPPKKFFGAARNIEEGGSLTILATALIETGSKADDVIFEEFKGTGNMELRLDRKLAERRIYPAIDVNASSTRHEELLFDRKQLELVWRLRRVLNGLADDGSSARAVELLIEKLKTTRSNEEFLIEVAKAQGTI